MSQVLNMKSLLQNFANKYWQQHKKGVEEYGGPLTPYKVDTYEYALEEMVDLLVYVDCLKQERDIAIDLVVKYVDISFISKDEMKGFALIWNKYKPNGCVDI